MKNSIAFILALPLLLMAANLHAQETGSPSFESYDTEYLRAPDRFTTPGGSDDKKAQATQPEKDTSSQRVRHRNVFKPAPVVPKDESKPKNQTDDSILSFNFLYYLIQKYKMQDILE